MIIEERLPCVFMCDEKEGKRGNYRRYRERMSERQSFCREGGSVATKIKVFS
jgi:hypothetical protein